VLLLIHKEYITILIKMLGDAYYVLESESVKIKKHKPMVNIRKIKKAKESKEKMVDRIADFLEMPEELVGDNTKITLVDNKYLYLEGKNQIIDYYDHYIKIKTKKVTITLDGKKMEIKEINDNELVVEGELLNISYNK